MANKAIEYKVTVYSDRTEWKNLNGLYHREDGPAIEWSNGDKSWWLNDKLHRVDGPAYEGSDGNKEWFLNGKQFTESEFIKATTKQVDCINGKVVEIDGKQYRMTEVK